MSKHRLCQRRFSEIIIKMFFLLLLSVTSYSTIHSSIHDDLIDDFGDRLAIMSACYSIQNRISDASEVFYPSDETYFDDIHHYSESSSILSVCSVEPGTSADVGIIMNIIRQRRVPFAVKGGGHIMNPKFSSTRGIHIAMRRFHKITYHEKSQTVDIGAGLLWDDVYRALEPYNVIVADGKSRCIGVAGVILGGGYGWKTSQYGLTMNNVFEYELVTPNGTIVRVNEDSYPEIFFGLKGGFNNFGIVTNFNMRVIPSTQVYGGRLTYSIYSSEQFDELANALVNFQDNNKDPRAVIDITITVESRILTVKVIVYYDAPTAPEHIFKELMETDHDGNLKTQSMREFLRKPCNDVKRGRYHTASFTQLTARLLKQCANQTVYNYLKANSKQGASFNIILNPYLPTYMDNAPNAAYIQSVSSTALFPICIDFRWELSSDDYFFHQAIQSTADILLETIIDDGQYDEYTKPILYPNFALETTPLSLMYGSNLPRLQRIRQAWDPENVMYLTSGWKF